MEWKRRDDTTWEIADPDFDGKAMLKETNSGYIAAITVSETQFDMELLDEREFFESRREAMAFLQDLMERDSY